MSEIIQQALALGFTAAAEFDPRALSFDDAEVLREACRGNDCGAYGKYWTCPPAIGSVEKAAALVRSYRRGLVVQLLTEAVSSVFQPELFTAVADDFNQMLRGLRPLAPMGDGRVFGMSNCHLCPDCTYPHAPCRFPEDAIYGISGACVNIYKLCDAVNLRQAAADESDFYGLLLFDKQN